jgi:hypothetical protein
MCSKTLCRKLTLIPLRVRFTIIYQKAQQLQ